MNYQKLPKRVFESPLLRYANFKAREKFDMMVGNAEQY